MQMHILALLWIYSFICILYSNTLSSLSRWHRQRQMNEYGEKSVPKPLFSPSIPFGLQWMWPNSALGILKKENDKVKEQVIKEPEGVRVLVLGKREQICSWPYTTRQLTHSAYIPWLAYCAYNVSSATTTPEVHINKIQLWFLIT